MEEMIELRRKRTNKGQVTSNNEIGLRFTVKDGRFVVFNNLSDLLKLENKDAVMFGISKKDNCIFVYKEDKQDDSYIVSKALSRGSYSRFASKELAKDIVNYLELDKKQVLEVAIKDNKQDYYFKIAGEANGKVKLIEYK